VLRKSGGVDRPRHTAPTRSADPARIKELERRNYQICENLKQRLVAGIKIDSCHSVDHLMRLPDTTNFMTDKKLKKGYQPGNRPARIVQWHPERVYELEELRSHPLPDDLAPTISGTEIDIEGALRIESLDALRDTYGIADWALLNVMYGDNVEVLHQKHREIGHRVDDGPYPGHRSEARYAVLT